MKVYFRTQNLAKSCDSVASMNAEWGDRRAEKLKQRLQELAVGCIWLEDIKKLPGARCHELKGAKKGMLSVDLVYPYRLIFIPANNPVPTKDDGGLDWAKITEIEITAVMDTH